MDGPHDLSNISGKKGSGVRMKWESWGRQASSTAHWAPAALHTVSRSRRPLLWERFLGACAISQAGEKPASGGGRLSQSRGRGRSQASSTGNLSETHIPGPHLHPPYLELCGCAPPCSPPR